MAIVHRATLTPSKPELLAAWLGGRPGAAASEVEVLGSYRFDDPAGEVGVEAILVRYAGRVRHVPLTYRGAPLDGADAALVGTMEHSVLGSRWAYLASADPIARECFARALRGEQETAVFEEYDDGKLVRIRPETVRITREGDGAPDSAAASDPAVVPDSAAVTFADDVTDGGLPSDQGTARLVATWEGGTAVVAALA